MRNFQARVEYRRSKIHPASSIGAASTCWRRIKCLREHFERLWQPPKLIILQYLVTHSNEKFNADSDFAIKRVLKLWSDWILAVQRNRPNNDLLRLHRIWLDQKQSIFVINQPRLFFCGNFYLVNRMSVSIEQPFFFECLPPLSYLVKSHRRSK